MKYRVGNKVKIKTWERMKKEYGLAEYGEISIGKDNDFWIEMEDIVKKIDKRVVEIVDVWQYFYYVKELTCFEVTDEMIECLIL